MKKKYWVILILVLLAIGFQLLTQYLIHSDTPPEIELLLNDTKNDGSVMSGIGGYRSYEINYNFVSRDKKEKYDFDVTVFGYSAYINYDGVAEFSQSKNKWQIISCDTTVHHY